MTSCISTMNVIAQDKKSFTLEDLMPGGNNYFNLQPKNLHGLKWWGDVCVNADIEEVKAVNPTNGKETVLFTLQDTNDLLAAKELGKMNHLYNVSFPYAEKWMLVNTSTHKVLIDCDKKEIIWSQPIAAKAANQDWNKDSRSLAYTIANNLFVTTADGKTHQVTDEPKGIVCGQSVHRQEFGIYKGTFWSPKGNLLAFYRMDETMVTDYPQVNTTTRIATLEPDKYPMTGMTSHKVTVGVYNPATEKTVYLKAGDPTDRYFTNISWSPDEKSVYVIELNRDQNHAELVRYNALVGTETTAPTLREGDLLVIVSLDRLGRNYTEIKEQWNYIINVIGADIVVLDMPLLDTRQSGDNLDKKFIADLVLQILSYVAQKELENTRRRQKQGMDVMPVINGKKTSLKTGRPTGRPNAQFPDNWKYYYEKWRLGEMTATKCMEILNLKRSTFYKLVKIYEKDL